MLHQEPQVWTIRDLMKFSIEHLQRHGFDEARLSVELLLSHALQCQRIELYTNFDKPLRKEELKQFRACFERRLHHEPVQYIVGSTSFMGLQFKIDPNVFIPRPETETLVEQAILFCNQPRTTEDLSVLEIGTGSGNIAVSLAKLVRGVRVTTIDTSENALDLARQNASLLGVSEAITFKKVNFLEAGTEIFPAQFDLLVSNPPYVPLDEWEKLDPEVRQFEPRVAITDLSDGLEFYRHICRLASRIVRKNGAVVVEVGDGQADAVRKLFREANLADVRAANDLQEVPRVVIGVN